MGSKRKSPESDMHALLAAIGKEPDAAAVLKQLHDAGFEVPLGPAQSLKSLASKLIDNTESIRQLAAVMQDLSRSANPPTALVNFLRYLDATNTPGVALGTVAAGAPSRELLSTIFGASQYMSDIVIRNPGYLYWLLEKRVWDHTDTKESYLAELTDTGRFLSLNGKLNAVRRFHRRALLRIGALDLMGKRTVEETARSLSHLADAIVEVAYRLLCDADPNTDRGETGTGFAVIALGKLGGRELNYSSDIDLIFVCDDVDDDAIEAHARLAKKLASALADVSTEGHLYRVDLRLRPDGRAGPLVNPITALMVYYQNRGRPWEFQAMLKARVIAGDFSLGRRFLERISALIFSLSLPYSPLDTIALMRSRIRENISARDRAFNIKLMEGGIRDIEFIAQALQLMHGSKHLELRTGNTIEALRVARSKRLIGKVEYGTLADAYRFFRLVEHRLQMAQQLQTHSLPEAGEDMEILARRVSLGPLGSFPGDRFLSALTKFIHRIRLLSDSFFAGEELPESTLLILLPEGDALADSILSKFGFSDPRRAYAIIQSLAHGSFPHLVDRQARAAFQKLLPVLLEDMARTGNPIQTLADFATVATAARNVLAFYNLLLESTPFRTMIRDITAASPVLTRKVTANFDILESLVGNADFVHESPVVTERQWKTIAEGSSTDEKTRAYHRIHRSLDRATLVAWVADIDSGLFPKALSKTITGVARCLVSSAFDALFPAKSDIAVLALGSFATGEPRLSSDLDLLVVANGELEAITRNIQRLGTLIADGNLLKLDFRLRGEGVNAPLVQDLAFYRRYFAERMSPWERIALARCALWCGDPAVFAGFAETLQPYLITKPDPRAIQTLRETRRRIESLVPAGSERAETKRSAGGRYDIDYACSVALARRGCPFALDAPARSRIRTLTQDGVFSEKDERVFEEALTLFERTEHLMDLAGHVLPRTPERVRETFDYLDKTMSLLGMEVAGGVERALQRCKTAVRERYNAVLGE
jgi:glutamate-ammonia-ligase adenylyltransferase